MTDRHASQKGRTDEGSTLILVLLLIVIASLVLVPVMKYTVTVLKAQTIQTNKAQAIEFARGGTWVALENEGGLYDDCVGGPLPSSLAGVSTTCEVLETATLRQPEEVPYSVGVVQANVGPTSASNTPATIPASIAATLSAGQAYVNPNTSAAPANWLTIPDWTYLSHIGNVWIPELPVQSVSSGGTRDTTMNPGTQEPGYTSCRVFFPGTFTAPITLTGPTYFTSGVYYFTEPVTVQRGANVVVGNGAETGCTTDFEAIASAVAVPEPLNMSGLGGTFVFGGNARLVITDSAGTGNIRFAMNQRYVSNEEASVSASSSVSIVSVNGNHAPLVGGETLGTDLMVNGVLAVPASKVDDPADSPDNPADDPEATTRGYTASVLTPKPTEPAQITTAPVATAARVTSGTNRGRATVTWTASTNDNGSLITQYIVESVPAGGSCTTTATDPAAPAPAPLTRRPTPRLSCTVTNLVQGTPYVFTVRAVNGVGPSPASTQSNSVTPTTTSNLLAVPTTALSMSTAPVPTMYANGMFVRWAAPPAAINNTTHGYTPINSFLVEARAGNTLAFPVVSTCTGWWSETGCLLGGLTAGTTYYLRVVASNMVGTGTTWSTFPGTGRLFTPSASTWTDTSAIPTATIRVPNAIVDINLTTSATANIKFSGYISVPQGHVRINTAPPTNKSIQMLGGVLAAQIRLGTPPATFQMVFDNPIAQKRIRLRSTATAGGYRATSEAIVQVNRSGSIAVNSWYAQ